MSRLRPTLILCALAAGLFLSLAAYMRHLERSALAGRQLNDQLTPAGQPRPLAEVARAVRQMKLITVEINTRVASSATAASWRGDVAARVEAPVRILYGSDLSTLDASRFAFSPVSGAYLIRIPPPQRLSTEVCTEESPEVEVGWLRLRSRAGEYYLGLARRDLYQRACELTLSPEDARMVREATRQQVEALVRRIIGPNAPITIAFTEDLAG
jgi:hypothetical protein